MTLNWKGKRCYWKTFASTTTILLYFAFLQHIRKSVINLEACCLKNRQKNVSCVELLELKLFAHRASGALGSWVLTKNLSSGWESVSLKEHAEAPWQEDTLSHILLKPELVLCSQINHGTTRIEPRTAHEFCRELTEMCTTLVHFYLLYIDCLCDLCIFVIHISHNSG